jgi:hypothetical protein
MKARSPYLAPRPFYGAASIQNLGVFRNKGSLPRGETGGSGGTRSAFSYPPAAAITCLRPVGACNLSSRVSLRGVVGEIHSVPPGPLALQAK